MEEVFIPSVCVRVVMWVNASSEEGRLAVNGMSYHSRAGENANSAIIVTVTPKDYGSDHPLAGMEFQRKLEEKAFHLAQAKFLCSAMKIFVKPGNRQFWNGSPFHERKLCAC